MNETWNGNTVEKRHIIDESGMSVEEKDMEKVTISLSTRTHRRLDGLANEFGVSQRELIEGCCERLAKEAFDGAKRER